MSRILILGGTRFIGRRIATLLAERHDVLVLSRNALEIPGARRIVADRCQGVARLAGERFDAVLDFLAYDRPGVAEACALGGAYVAVSSAWLSRVNETPHLLPITREYLLGKARVEGAIAELRAAGAAATAVRLPIVMGAGDHTRRLEFYRTRVADGGPLVLVNGGTNVAQVLWSEDAARVLAALVESDRAAATPIWSALPGDGQRVREFVGAIGRSLDRFTETVDVPAATLASELPSYLDAEPLWRESVLAQAGGNVFTALGVVPTPLDVWLTTLPPAVPARDSARDAEVALARKVACSTP